MSHAADVDQLAETLWRYHRLNQTVGKSDCIIGLGSYDLRVAERCADLFEKGQAPSIVFSGHSGNWTKGLWDESEAEVFAKHAIARGVPQSKIRLESRSTNIGENLRFTKELLSHDPRGLKAVTIVTKPSTERRVYATCPIVWPDMSIYITSPQIDFDEQRRRGSQDGLIHEMVGDLQRMQVYPSLGFQVPQHIPDEVWAAYETLLSLGYDKHLIKDREAHDR